MKKQTSFQGQEVWLVENGAGAIRVAPQCGGLLLDWRVDDREIVRWPADADWSRPTKVRGGNPVLFPFIARHYVDGVLGRWKDAAGVVRELPMHGFGRDMAYGVVDSDDASLRMGIREDERTLGFYPFPFRFEIAYALAADGRSLEVELATTNTGDKPLPYYAGHHFYFAVDHRERADWKLELPFRKTGARAGENSGAVAFGAPPLDATLDDPKLIDRFQVEPLKKSFSLANAKKGVAIGFDLEPRATVPWHTVTTWTASPDSDFYCVEPWLGLPDAINQDQALFGLRWLAPGATERAVCALRATLS